MAINQQLKVENNYNSMKKLFIISFHILLTINPLLGQIDIVNIDSMSYNSKYVDYSKLKNVMTELPIRLFENKRILSLENGYNHIDSVPVNIKI